MSKFKDFTLKDDSVLVSEILLAPRRRVVQRRHAEADFCEEPDAVVTVVADILRLQRVAAGVKVINLFSLS